MRQWEPQCQLPALSILLDVWVGTLRFFRFCGLWPCHVITEGKFSRYWLDEVFELLAHLI